MSTGQNSPNPGAKTRKSRNGTDFASSLDSYLNNIGKISQADPEIIQTLVETIDDLQLQLEKKLSFLGFTALEFCRYLDECCNSGCPPEDYFLISSLRGGNDVPPQNLIELLKQWQLEIRQVHQRLEKAFTAGKNCTEIRQAMADLLGRFRPNGQMSNELYQTATGYIELNPENSGQSEQRFLMSGPELQQNLAELRELREKLDQLHSRMAEANLRLVVSIAGKYRESGVPLNDIIQEGNLGLMVAVQRFDFKLGNRFSPTKLWPMKTSSAPSAMRSHPNKSVPRPPGRCMSLTRSWPPSTFACKTIAVI